MEEYLKLGFRSAFEQLLKPHAGPYTALAAGHCPTPAVFASTGDFQGTSQGVDS